MGENLCRTFSHRLNEPPPPLEATRAFLRSYVADADGSAEIQAEIAHLAAINPARLVRALDAIEALLADLPSEGVLAKLVALDGNHVLADPGDTGAAIWLRELAASLRKALGEDSRAT